MSADTEPSIAERVERLRDDAANESVAELLAIVDELHDELVVTKSELASTQAELHNLKRDLRETGPSDSHDIDMTLDRRDEAIVRRLEREDSDTFSLSQMQSIVREETDICQKDTVRRRLKRVTQNGPLRREGQTWHYTGIRQANQ